MSSYPPDSVCIPAFRRSQQVTLQPGSPLPAPPRSGVPKLLIESFFSVLSMSPHQAVPFSPSSAPVPIPIPMPFRGPCCHAVNVALAAYVSLENTYLREWLYNLHRQYSRFWFLFFPPISAVCRAAYAAGHVSSSFPVATAWLRRRRAPPPRFPRFRARVL